MGSCLDIFFQHSTHETSCVPYVSNADDLFYPWLLIPAVVLVMLLSMTTTRKGKLLGCCFGRPGFVTPMNALARSHRLSYAAAFGAISFLCYQIILGEQQAFPCPGHAAVRSLCKIMSVLVYGTCYFPLFASLAVDCIFGYAIGSLYAWTLTGKKISDFFPLRCSPADHVIDWLSQLPHLLCLGFLCVSIPVRLVGAIRARRPVFRARDDAKELCSLEAVRDSYQGIHVRELLKPRIPPPPPPAKDERTLTRIKLWFLSIFQYIQYKRMPHFQYPARLVSVMTVSICLVFQISVRVMGYMLLGLSILRSEQGEVSEKLQQCGFDPVEVHVLFDILNAIYGTLIAATLLASIAAFFGIKQILNMYRTNLLALYRGDRRHLGCVWKRSNARRVVAFIRYGGYQVAYITWGFVLQYLSAWLALLILSGAILILKYHEPWVLFTWLVEWIPTLVVFVAVYVSQTLLAHFLFLQNKGEHLALDNRRFLFIFTYFMFFYNIFIGFFSCVLRVSTGAVVGILLIARLDRTTLPRKFEFLDRGFKAYVGFLQVEYSHTHPVVLVFLQLLRLPFVHARGSSPSPAFSNSLYVDSAYLAEIGRSEYRTTEDLRRLRARLRWHLAFTLVRNPQFQPLRKGRLPSRNIPASASADSSVA